MLCLPSISLMCDAWIKTLVYIWWFASVNGVVGMLLLFSKNMVAMHALCSLFGQHSCLLILHVYVSECCIWLCRGWALIDGSHTDCLSCCILNSYISGYSSITLLVNNMLCAVNNNRNVMYYMLIYLWWCMRFFFLTTVHLSCFFRLGWVINCRGISVFFRILYTNVISTLRSRAVNSPG